MAGAFVTVTPARAPFEGPGSVTSKSGGSYRAAEAERCGAGIALPKMAKSIASAIAL